MKREELEAIRKRAEASLGTTSAKSVYPTRAYDVIYEDVPVLLAEVERLNKSRDWYDGELYRCIDRNTVYSEEINRLKGKIALYEALAQENDYYAILNEMSEDDD